MADQMENTVGLLLVSILIIESLTIVILVWMAICLLESRNRNSVVWQSFDRLLRSLQSNCAVNTSLLANLAEGKTHDTCKEDTNFASSESGIGDTLPIDVSEESSKEKPPLRKSPERVSISVMTTGSSQGRKVILRKYGARSPGKELG